MAWKWQSIVLAISNGGSTKSGLAEGKIAGYEKIKPARHNIVISKCVIYLVSPMGIHHEAMASNTWW